MTISVIGDATGTTASIVVSAVNLAKGLPVAKVIREAVRVRRRGFDPISRLDANQNGVVDQSEIDGIPERFRRMMDARGFKLESGESVDTVRNRVRQRFENERRERERRNDDSSDNDRANRSTPPPAFKPRDRERITVDLPESYAEVDSDLDGQIGLYEWIVARRNDLELFDEIDRNSRWPVDPTRTIRLGQAQRWHRQDVSHCHQT